VWDLPFQQGFPIRKEAFPVFSPVKTKWCGFQEPVGLGFPQTSARTSKENGISCRSQTVLAAGGMGLIFGLMAFGHQKSHHGCECEAPKRRAVSLAAFPRIRYPSNIFKPAFLDEIRREI